MKSNTIYIADNLDALRGIKDESVDLIYLDPPYNSNRKWMAFPKGRAKEAFVDQWALNDIDEAWWGRLAHKNPTLYHVIMSVAKLDNSREGKNVSYCIYMAIRLLEMHRVLKSTGALVLQCDDVMGPHSRFILDAIFDPKNFRNVIAWHRRSGGGVANNTKHQLPRAFDYLYYYAKSVEHEHAPLYNDYEQEYVDVRHKRDDNDGRGPYRDGSVNKSTGKEYEFMGVTAKWTMTKEKMQALYDDNRLFKMGTGKFWYKKVYLNEAKGVPVSNFWDDIDLEPLDGYDKYDTRKPLALLQRVIRMASKPGDLVLDPFCGCATACVAAEVEGRKWVGIDLGKAAADIIAARLVAQIPAIGKVKFNHGAWKGKPVHDYSPKEQLKDRLYGECDGECIGCASWKPHADMDVDHIISKDRGDHELEHDDNKQLLCRTCNGRKHNKPMKYLMSRNLELGVIPEDYYNDVMRRQKWPEWDY